MKDFKNKFALWERLDKSQKLLQYNFHHRPIILGPHPQSKLPCLQKYQFVIQKHNTIGFITSLLRNKVQCLIQKVEQQKSLEVTFLFGQSLADDNSTVLDVYNKHKDEDGFLYVFYRENSAHPQTKNQPKKSQTQVLDFKLPLQEKQKLSIEEQQNLQIKAKCTEMHQVAQICTKQFCRQPILMCLTQNCKCQINHQKCTKISVKSAVNKIKNKLFNYDKTDLDQSIDKVFDKIIDDICDIRDQLRTTLKEHLKYYQVNYPELYFLNVIETGDEDIFIDKYDVNEGLQRKKGSHQLLQQIKTILNVHIKQIHSSALEKCNQIVSEIYKDLKQKSNKLQDSQKLMQWEKKMYYQAQKRLDFKESSIIKDDRQKCNLWINLHEKNQVQDFQKIPNQKPFQSVKLLYKASEENFDIAKYFEKCGNAKNTLILCLTNKDRIIGAYTPLSHGWDENENKEGPWTEDKQNKSLIFSLSSMDKFNLKNATQAIYRGPKKKSIKFGDGQFQIGDKSNVQPVQSGMNKSYQGAAYYSMKYYQRKFHKDFTGNDSNFFTTKEWEVWQFQDGEK